MAKTKKQAITFAQNLEVSELSELKAELTGLRTFRPLVKRSDGRYEGDILGFVKGLRLSAKLIYFLRNRLSTTGLHVNWGHLIADGTSCSPECDVIVHVQGHVKRWNGGDHPIMDFMFVDARQARAVISCKSRLQSIDKQYPKALKKYGVKHIFLFAECCDEARFEKLKKAAMAAGYAGLWCLYLERKGAGETANEVMYVEFGKAVARAVAS